MKLQWIPRPNSRGGFEPEQSGKMFSSSDEIYYGFDRFGDERGCVISNELGNWTAVSVPYLPQESWEAHQKRITRASKKEAMLLVESFIEEE